VRVLSLCQQAILLKIGAFLNILFIALVVLIFGAGCQETELGTPIASGTMSSLPLTTTPELTESLAAPISSPTNMPTSLDTLEPTLTSPSIQEEWLKYENSEYGFSFTYPTGWTPIELQNRVSLAYQALSISLRIGVRLATEDVELVRSGVPAGDLIREGTVAFLGQVLERNVLVYQEKDKAVLYNNGGEIEVDGLVFVISLESNRFDYKSIEIPEDIQGQVDQILESFELD